jgi:hypothetical protein
MQAQCRNIHIAQFYADATHLAGLAPAGRFAFDDRRSLVMLVRPPRNTIGS